MLKRVLLHVLTSYTSIMKRFKWHQYSYIGALPVCVIIILSAQNFSLNCFWLCYVRHLDHSTKLRTDLATFLLT